MPPSSSRELTESMVIDRVTRLCEIPSVSKEEERISVAAAEQLKSDGLEVEIQEVLPKRRNVIAYLRTGRPGPRLLFNGHLDTLPPPKGYTRDPYKVSIENGRLYAAEVNNMKAAVGAMMGVMASLCDRRSDLTGEVVLSAVIGECDAMGLGTVALLENGFKADFCINGEPTDLAIMTAHSGVTQLKLVVKGRSAHVSQRAHGLNAIDKLVSVLPELSEKALTFRAHADFPGLPTINVGTIRGGSLPSMLADRAEAGIDVRTVPGMTPESVLVDLMKIVENRRRSDPAFEAELSLAGRPEFCQERPFHMDRGAHIINIVTHAHRSVFGADPTIGTLVPQLFFGTDASHILAAGIPTAIYGPGKVTDINCPNESMAVKDILWAANVYLSSALLACSRSAEETQ
jgi:acetylornithine deacetylase